MLERIYKCNQTIERLRSGLLGKHVDIFAEFLVKQGYSSKTIYSKFGIISNFSRWLIEERYELRELTEEGIGTFLEHYQERNMGTLRRGDGKTLTQLIDFLRRTGVVHPVVLPSSEKNSTERLIKSYACYLQDEGGLSSSTIERYSGCRINELTALNRQDFDDRIGCLVIRNSKCDKSRFLPLHPTTLRQLRKYNKLRDQFHPALESSAFFVSEKGTRITDWSARYVFIQLSNEIGLRASSDSYGPRIHDMRHAFAVKLILRWYREGADVNQKIALLTTYLGHKKSSDTYWYVTGVPELLAAAANRLENQIGG